MFGSSVGFSRSADRMALFPVSNCDISAARHPIYSVFGSRTGFSWSADRMALFPVSPYSIGMWEKTMREE